MGEQLDQILMSQRNSPPAFRRSRRRELADLYFWVAAAEICVLLASGLAAMELAWSFAGLARESGVIAAGIAALVAFELLRLPAPSGPGALVRRKRTVFLDVGAATAAAAAALALQHATPGALLCWDACFAMICVAGLVLLRAGFGILLRRMLNSGRLAMNVAVFGSGAVSAKNMTRLQQSDPRLVAVVGRYSSVRESAPREGRARGNARLLLADCRLGVVDAVVLAMEPDDEDEFARVRRLLQGCVQDIYVALELLDLAPPGVRPASLGATPLLLVSERPLKGYAKYANIAFNQVGAMALLLLLLPVIALIAVAIKLDSPGPVLFRQLRVGYNGQLFWILKFRSMHNHASDRLAKQQTVFDDARVTRVGRVIRRLSIDEFPQLINVLRGEMSLVGPRPHAPGTSIGGRRIHQVLDDYERRQVVLPGITGLAQVRGFRGGLHTLRQASDRLASDLEYVRRASIWLDLNILFLTFLREVRARRGL